MDVYAAPKKVGGLTFVQMGNPNEWLWRHDQL